KESRIRYSMHSALRILLESHTKSTRALEVLVDTLNKGHNVTEEITSILDLIPKWCSLLTSTVFADVVQWIVRKIFENTNNPLLIKVMVQIAKVEKIAECSSILLDAIIDRMESSEENLSQEALLFKRLGPLLVLRTLPLSCV